ncbi:MAG TPA: type I glyceraldehyde-3-phosphate dehydrogenase [Bacteroidia bacterium]|nr:type I glyceraldehyde-3-phosphate dehydrogenase [Bacteroidia bacterium]
MKIGINGLGRIGRTLLKTCLKREGIEVVAINEPTNNHSIAHLLKYDSIHGKFDGTISANDDGIFINDRFINVSHHLNIESLDWAKYDVSAIVESTGLFLDSKSANMHLLKGAKKVILSAPPKDNSIKSIVLGVNDHILESNDLIISNASCTTNSAAPLIKVIDDLWKVKSAFITTVHSYTGDQKLIDSPHNDLRRARAAALSIIPTSTGAAKALTKIFPKLEGNIGGGGIRVPVPDGSLTDITMILEQIISEDEVNNAFKKVAENDLKGIIEYTNDPIVSSDIIGNTHSVIFDSLLTSVVGPMVKVVGWYDNEVGYSNRLFELLDR